MKIRKSRNQPRNASARGLHFDRHRNRVAVIFHAENHRQLAEGRGVHRLPELAFAGSAIAQRNVSDFIALKANVLELPVISMEPGRKSEPGAPFLASFARSGELDLRRLRMPRQISPSLGTPHCLQDLRPRRRRLGHDMQLGIAPVRRHLPPAGTRIIGRTHSLQKHVVRLERPAPGTTRGRGNKDRTSRILASAPARRPRQCPHVPPRTFENKFSAGV